MKRFFDIIGSFILIIILSPILILITILIFRCPIYLSERHGRLGKRFKMFKFRSMTIGAAKLQHALMHLNEKGVIFKIERDPRITTIGKFIRKTSIDELPQLFNVLFGSMSLVGPRPLPIDQIDKNDYRQKRRLLVKPGITGLWQIRGRSETSFERMLKWDIWYIEHHNIWIDLKILVKTIPVVIRGRGAW